MIKLFTVVLSIFLLSFSTFSKGKNPEEISKEKVEYVEVIGHIPISKSIQSISVIEKDEIQALKMVNLKEVLSMSPGVLTLSNGKFGQSSSTFIRGSRNTQILYLIDGVKIRDDSSIGGINLSLIPAFLIKKVEVVKGPLSSIYGSDAMGGVVNISLGGSSGTKMLLNTGSHGSYQANFSTSDQKNGIFYSISSSIQSYKDNSMNDLFKNIGFQGKVDFKSDGFFKGGLLFFINSVDSGIPFNNTGAPSPNRKFKSNNFLTAVPLMFNIGENSKIKTTLSFKGNSYKFEDSDDMWSPYYANSSKNIEIDTVFNSYFSKNIDFSAGFDFSTTKIFSENSYGTVVDNRSRNYFSSFIKADADLGSLFLTSSIRFDKYKSVKANFSPQLGVSLKINDKIKVRTSYSQSFKAPILIQQINPWGAPNFNLNPEKGISGEIGADIFLKQHILGFTVFKSTYTDMIDWVTIDPVTWQGQYQNIKEAKIDGFEFSFSSSIIKNTVFELSYTHLKSIDESTGLPLKRRPKDSLTASVRYSSSHFTVGFNTIYVGKRGDYNFMIFPPDINMPSYNVYNLNITIPVKKKFNVYGKLTNLFNSKYSEIFGYLTPGRRFEIGILYN